MVRHRVLCTVRFGRMLFLWDCMLNEDSECGSSLRSVEIQRGKNLLDVLYFQVCIEKGVRLLGNGGSTYRVWVSSHLTKHNHVPTVSA